MGGGYIAIEICAGASDAGRAASEDASVIFKGRGEAMGSGGSKRKGKVSRVGRGEELDAILGDNPNRPVAERLSALRARIQALQTHITKIESEEATKLVKGSRATAGISSVKITPTGDLQRCIVPVKQRSLNQISRSKSSRKIRAS